MDVVQVLVAKGANLNAKDISDLTPLQLAILGDHEEISKLLIAKGADVNAADNMGITILDEATRKGNVGIIEMLKQAGAKCGTSNCSC
jgi:ankyrin repeat protein